MKKRIERIKFNHHKVHKQNKGKQIFNNTDIGIFDFQQNDTQLKFRSNSLRANMQVGTT